LRVVNEHIRDINTLDHVIRQLHTQGRDSLIASAQQDLKGTTEGLTRFVERYADTTNYLPNALFAIRILNPLAEEQFVNTFIQTLPRRFGDAKQAKEFTERWNKMLAQRKNATQPQQNFTGGVVMGALAPAITLPNPQGQTISLASLKGQYVLVDFWASWCPPCRAENPNVVAVFNKYKDKGFTVFGVSLDDNKEKWQKAIQDDGLAWTQVSDLKRWESVAARDYGVESIPTNFLLDKEGKIIARDLRGPALEAKLAEVLK
jgi:peroxiredoxin